MDNFDIQSRQFMVELCRLALAAGANAMRHYKTALEIEQKADNSPVTIADKEGEEIISAGLARLCPDIQIIGEETMDGRQPPDPADCFFLLDPLDGTKEFINKRTDFTVNIGLIENAKPVAGVVYAPALSRLFFTLGTERAFELRLAPELAEFDITTARAIYARPPPQDGLVAVVSHMHHSSATDDFLAGIKVKKLIAAGSSLKICLLAAGEADIYPRHGRTMEWDIAAAHAILLAAGGRITGLDGAPLAYGKSESDFANPHFIAYGA